MSYKATVVYTGDGTQTTYSFGFEYLKKSFVKVQLLSGTMLTYGVDYTILSHDVIFVTAPTGIFTVYRETDSTPLVSWVDASILKAVDMNLTQIQQEHIIEESSDKLSRTSMVVNETTNQWEGRNLRLTNVANPVDSGDVATKGYIEGVQSGLIADITAVKNSAVATIEGLKETVPAELVQIKDDAVTAKNEAVAAKDIAVQAKDDAVATANTLTLATQAEAEAGTNAVHLMTPLRVEQQVTKKLSEREQAIIASTPADLDDSKRVANTAWIRSRITSLVYGCIASVATQAGFEASIDTSGYIKFPTWLGAGYSLLIQWGEASCPGSPVTVTFTKAYSIRPQVLVSPGTDEHYENAAINDQPTTTQFTIRTRNMNMGTCRWLSIGRG